MIRVKLPHHLRTLAGLHSEVQVEVQGVVTQRAVLDAVEAKYPVLIGTMRDRNTLQRRSMLRVLPAAKTYPTSRRTHRCRMPLPMAQSRC